MRSQGHRQANAIAEVCWRRVELHKPPRLEEDGADADEVVVMRCKGEVAAELARNSCPNGARTCL